MKLQVLSDLHLRPAYGFAIPETEADLIILAGDIARGLTGVQWAMEESARLGKPVAYVFGNHEYFKHVFPDLLDEARRLTAGSAVHVLENDQLIWDQTRILGCTLWTDFLLFGEERQQECIAAAESVLYDYSIIQTPDGDLLRAHHTQARHWQSRQWLEQRLSEPWPGPTVVVTHHVPCWEGAHPDYNGPLSGGFTSNLKPLMERHRIDLWICGHSHANVDVQLGKTRLLSNQRGYPGEVVPGPAFDPTLLAEVG